jgi:hypothetical protein
MKFIDFCDKHRILLAILPPHSTHWLQPLDVSLFSPLAQYYSQELDLFQLQSEGFTRFRKRNFFATFWKAWNRTFTEKNIFSGWKKTGLSPFNPEVVLSQVRSNADTEERPSSSESTSTPSSGWPFVERTMLDLFGPNPTREQRKSLRIVKEVFTTCQIQERRIEGYQASLKMEQSRRQRQKPLFKPIENGGAAFYSPNKVQIVRNERQREMEVEQQLQAAKEDAKLQRQLQKEKEEQEKQERAVVRAEDKVRRENEKAKKQQETAARIAARKQAIRDREDAAEADKQLHREAQVRKQPAPKSKGSKKAELSLMVDVEAEIVETTSGRLPRARRLPSRFTKDVIIFK